MFNQFLKFYLSWLMNFYIDPYTLLDLKLVKKKVSKKKKTIPQSGLDYLWIDWFITINYFKLIVSNKI